MNQNHLHYKGLYSSFLQHSKAISYSKQRYCCILKSPKGVRQGRPQLAFQFFRISPRASCTMPTTSIVEVFKASCVREREREICYIEEHAFEVGCAYTHAEHALSRSYLQFTKDPHIVDKLQRYIQQLL